MTLTPRTPKRPLIWSDAVLDLQDLLLANPNTRTDGQTVYIVGGAVRDAYLHRPIHDIDLVTNGNATRLARQIANLLKGDLFVMDAERDVARVLLGDPASTDDTQHQGVPLQIDISTMRRGDGNLFNDLQDRDFTLNAMAVDLLGDLGQLIDPLNGEQDLLSKQLRRCSPHAIAHDVIRTLRAVRQSVQLGVRIEPETLTDIRHYAAHITETSPERIRDEFFKLLSLDNAPSALRVAQRLGLITAILPALNTLSPDQWEHTLRFVERLNTILSTISFKRTDNTAATFEMGLVVMTMDRYRATLNQLFLETEWADHRPHRALVLLAGLLHSIKKHDDYAEALRLSNAEKVRLNAMLTHYQHPVFEADVTPLTAHRYWYTLGEAGLDVILLSMAHTLTTGEHRIQQDIWITRTERIGVLLEAYFMRYEELVAPQPFLDGNDLKTQLQLPAGRIIGELLTHLREAQVQGLITDQAQALALAQAYLAHVEQ